MQAGRGTAKCQELQIKMYKTCNLFAKKSRVTRPRPFLPLNPTPSGTRLRISGRPLRVRVCVWVGVGVWVCVMRQTLCK